MSSAEPRDTIRNTKRVAVIPGDDAAPEAVAAAMTVLQALELPIEYNVLPDGEVLGALPRAERWSTLVDAIDDSDTTLFGATSGKTGGVSYLRWGKATYANVRPVKARTGISSRLRDHEGIDYVIVRENLEEAYLGFEGSLDDLRAIGFDLSAFGGRIPIGDPVTGNLPEAQGAYSLRVITEEGSSRIARFAADLAVARLEGGGAGLVTAVVKTNVLRKSDVLFRDIVEEVVAEYPDLRFEERLFDDAARLLVTDPERVDVIVAPNLYGDVLSDEGAATVGGLGVAPSGCYGADYAYFEPAHGTAPDIAGKGVINPMATLYSATMMLRYLGFEDDADRVDTAIDGIPADRRTPDVGGKGSTHGVAEAIVGAL